MKIQWWQKQINLYGAGGKQPKCKTDLMLGSREISPAKYSRSGLSNRNRTQAPYVILSMSFHAKGKKEMGEIIFNTVSVTPIDPIQNVIISIWNQYKNYWDVLHFFFPPSLQNLVDIFHSQRISIQTSYAEAPSSHVWLVIEDAAGTNCCLLSFL